ncbi:hypothetical protein PM10SUCC1_06190 [Propionigenium maris DSM 9537]|uniref:Uncharacterized protein n=1 Tax=Propionigenium maris DSM 9537 TaxID=1123000 RepID=A0A9W6GH19_9FUSO|nr:hypothetical protein [Propionigenium maris]GLI55104.1 hypothetical protein PM10SUCC1_06190 [Propionigenium maris DSM 9537]
MKISKENHTRTNSTIFILYKNKKQTFFKDLTDIEITQDKMLLNRTPGDSLTINMNSIEYYKIY